MITAQTQNETVRPASRMSVSDFTGVAARWLLGSLFVYLGLSKALHPEEFLKLIREYQFVGYPWINVIAAGLPWFEVFCGLLLLAGVAVRGAALVSIGMLVPFTLLVLRRAYIMAAQSHEAFCTIKFDCGCGSGEVVACNKFIENACLVLVAAWLVSGRGRFLSARYNLLK
jgi:uncharacterized membrane protein YphA (DoxX/SURF4 family)